jgi:hypothetical protein
VWGPPSLGGEQNLISVNDSPFEVTPNLLKALSGLRSESNVRVVWIDAICINQEDLEERSHQVQLMKQIYENATRTVVFLGEASELSTPTINFIKSLKIKWQWNSSVEMEEFQRAGQNLAERVATDEHLQILTTKGLFGDLLERPFWKRIWIVQEVVLGRSVTIICGPDEIPWQEFLDATWTLSEAFSSDVQNIGRNSNLGSLGNLINIDSFRALKDPNVRASIGDVVACLRQSNATDPRDMIFGVMGLIQSSIKPDYVRSTTEDVYMSLVEECFVSDKSLDIICMRRKPTSRFKLPSWVPDWSDTWVKEPGSQNDLIEGSNLPPNPLIMKYFDAYILTQSVSESRRRADDGEEVEVLEWAAHNMTRPKASIDRSLGILTAQGIHIGHIKYTGRVLAEDEEGTPPFYEALADWEEMMLQIFGNCKSLQGEHYITDILDQWLQVFTSGSTDSDGVLTDELKGTADRRLEERARRRLMYKETSHPYLGGGCMVEAFLRTICGDRDEYYQRFTEKKCRSFWEIEKDGKPKWDLVLCHMVFATDRRFMILNNGCIGLAPIRAREGDIVCVLLGCSVPVLLREGDDGKVTFVGEVYVHGFMDGEAIAVMKAGKIEKKEWKIS